MEKLYENKWKNMKFKNDIENQYICEFCNKKFKHSNSYYRHCKHYCTKRKELDNDKSEIQRLKDENEKLNQQQSITNNTNRLSNGIDGDVPLGYRLGLKDNHGLSSVSEVGLNTGNEDIKKSFTARSGIRFNPQTSLSISFNESISSNINGYSIDIRSISRDYISFGNNLSKGFPFINWSFRIGGLEKIGFIKPYVSSVSLEHAFSGKQNLSWKFNEDGVTPINLFDISFKGLPDKPPF